MTAELVIAPEAETVRRFPYAVFYEYSNRTVTLYCVFHTSQNPDKWRERLA